jgi:hypothetical protein
LGLAFFSAVFLVMAVVPYARAGRSLFRFNASSHKTETELNGEPVVLSMADAFVRSLLRTWSRPAPLAALAGAVALTGLGLGGCAHLPSYPFYQPPVDVTSPIAEDIRKASPDTEAYPSFLSVPPLPQDVRPVSAWTRNVYNTLRERRQSQAMTVLYPQSLYGAEAFAQEQRLKAAPPMTPAQAAAQSDATAKFAKDQRDRAKAPSPAQ